MTPSPLLLKAVRESRLEIAQEYSALCSELDLQKKIKQSFKQHPFLWLTGAVSAGLLTTIFGMRRSPDRAVSTVAASSTGSISPSVTLAKAGWVAGALQVGKLLYPILKPIILEYAHKTVQGGLAKKNKT
ncbi:MAG: hypothetical protein WCP60_00130 [bacterium]